MSSQSTYKVIAADLVEHGEQRLRIVLCHRENSLYVAGTPNLSVSPWSSDPSTFTAPPLRRLELANIHPPFTMAMTNATGILDPHKYVKRPSYLKTLSFVSVDELLRSNKVAFVMKREIAICEYLKQNPHPNVATYFGVEAGRVVSIPRVGVAQTFPYDVVTGLAFERYESDLENMVLNGEPIDIAKVVADVHAGLAHMHSLGIVHADIKPSNIFHKMGRFAVGDFDSAHMVGQAYELKGGTDGWTDPEWEVAEAGHDWAGLDRLVEYLEDVEAMAAADFE